MDRGEQGNLVARCPIQALQSGPVDLVFFDPISALGARVSVGAGMVLGAALSLLALVKLVPRRRAVVASRQVG